MASTFRSPNLFWWILILSGLGLLFVTWLIPSVLDTKYLPLIGPFAAWMGTTRPTLVQYIVYVAVFIHVLEALYATSICFGARFSIGDTFKWTLQTFVVGFPSLNLLKKIAKAKVHKRK